MGTIIVFLFIIGLVFIFISVLIDAIKRPPVKKQRGRKKRKGNTWGRTIVIYKLMDGRKAFYVGQTSRGLDTRLREHMNDVSGTDKAWYIHQNMNGRAPKIKEITRTKSQKKANELENHYIRKWGLTNMKWA